MTLYTSKVVAQWLSYNSASYSNASIGCRLQKLP